MTLDAPKDLTTRTEAPSPAVTSSASIRSVTVLR